MEATATAYPSYHRSPSTSPPTLLRALGFFSLRRLPRSPDPSLAPLLILGTTPYRSLVFLRLLALSMRLWRTSTATPPFLAAPLVFFSGGLLMHLSSTTGISAKCQNNPLSKCLLLTTGNKTLAKASLSNLAWSLGLEAFDLGVFFLWPGHNLLSHVLMKLRRLLRQHHLAPSTSPLPPSRLSVCTAASTGGIFKLEPFC